MRPLLTVFLVLAMRAQDPAAQAEKLLAADRFEEAAPLFQQALRQDPANTDVRYRLAYTWFRLRRLDLAGTEFREVIRRAPPAPSSRYFLGRIALLENRPSEAVDWLKGLNVQDAESQLAQAYAALGQHARAVAPLRAAIAKTPWDSNLHYRLGRIWQQTGKAELAAESLATAARLKEANREDVAALMAAGQALGEHKVPDALAEGARIKQRPQPDPDALVALGVLYGGAGLELEAIDTFRLAVSRQADHFQAQYNLGLALLRSNRIAESFAPLQAAIQLLPQSAEAGLTFGLACVMSQRYADAVTPLERSWQADRTNPRAGSLLATALLRTGAAARAAAVLKSVVALPGADAASHLLLVEALNAAQDPAGALLAAQAGAKAFAPHPQVRMALAQQLARAGRYQEARPEFEQVLALKPGHPEAELGVADCLQKAGQHEPAVPHFRAALPAAATAASARTGLARSLTALNRLGEARELLEEGIARDGRDPALRLELARVLARLGHAALAAEQSRIATELKKP